jgi:hypothetical protein
MSVREVPVNPNPRRTRTYNTAGWRRIDVTGVESEQRKAKAIGSVVNLDLFLFQGSLRKEPHRIRILTCEDPVFEEPVNRRPVTIPHGRLPDVAGIIFPASQPELRRGKPIVGRHREAE